MRPRLTTQCIVQGCGLGGLMTRGMCKHHYNQWYGQNRGVNAGVRDLHGHARSGQVSHEWQVWQRMKRRCLTPTAADYPRYGGRGIGVCQRWLDFRNFLADMGPRPSPEHSLDRINNNGNYEPGNVRWATIYQQANNKRNNRILTLNGESLTLPQWSRRLSINPSTIRTRLSLGWSIERVLTEPVGPVGKNQFS